MLRSSAKPVSARPARTAAKRPAKSSRDLALRKPTTGIAGCCARAKSGQATAEPAIPLMKSRRRIACPKAQDHADFQKGLQQGFTTGGIGSDRQFCVATTIRTECPLWVKSRHSAVSERCPLYPRKRTFTDRCRYDDMARSSIGRHVEAEIGSYTGFG